MTWPPILVGNHEQAQGNQFDVSEAPDFFLQSHAGPHFVEALALAHCDRVRRSLAARLLPFCLLPQGFQFFHGGLLRSAPRRAQLFFHPLKAPAELAIGLSQR